jgi:hypothetical protein
MLKKMFSSSTAAAVGSRITVYLPGSRALALTEPAAFWTATLVAAAVSSLLKSL